MIHLGFTGTRHGMTANQLSAVRVLVLELAPAPAPFIAHHGDCVGADAEFHTICREHAVRCRIIIHPGPADDAHQAGRVADERREPRRHMRRNADIVAESTVMLATPYEAVEQELGGTWRTIGMARKKKRPLAIVLPDGTVQKECWP